MGKGVLGPDPNRGRCGIPAQFANHIRQCQINLVRWGVPALGFGHIDPTLRLASLVGITWQLGRKHLWNARFNRKEMTIRAAQLPRFHRGISRRRGGKLQGAVAKWTAEISE